MNMLKLRLHIFILSVFISFIGVKTIWAESALDTPAHHYQLGMDLLEQGRLEDAEAAFNKAIKLEEKHAPAHAGLALVMAERGDRDGAFMLLKRTNKYANSREDKSLYLLTRIRVSTEVGKKKWLKHAKIAYQKYSKKNGGDEGDLYMGLAYKKAFLFPEAEDVLRTGMNKKGPNYSRLSQEYELVQQIQRAAPGTENGKRVAIQPELTRGEVAAIIISELDWDAIHRKAADKGEPTFLTPDEALLKNSKNAGQNKMPPDIQRHPLDQSIQKALAMGIRGLETRPDGTFGPDEKMAKSNFAVILEDILVKGLNDPKISRSSMGSDSPFSDVASEHFAHNAILVTTSRGILSGNSNGTFGVTDSVSGAEALLALKKVKNILGIQ